MSHDHHEHAPKWKQAIREKDLAKVASAANYQITTPLRARSYGLRHDDSRVSRFFKSRGTIFSTPLPELGFPDLKPGDRWCLCAPRWQEAFEANQAPRVVLRATYEAALSYCSLADLKRLAVDLA